MFVAGREPIQVQLIQIVSNAFEEYARTHQELQRKVNNSIMDLFEQHGQDKPWAEHCQDKPRTEPRTVSFDLPEDSSEVHLPVPVVPQLAILSAQSWEPVEEIPTDCVEKSPSNFTHAGSNPTTVATVYPQGKDITHEVSVCPVSSRTGKTLSTKSACAHTVTSVTSMTRYKLSNCKDIPQSTSTIYMATTGKLTYSRTFQDLPSWVRLAELLLNSNDLLLSRLANFWSDIIAPTRQSRHHQFNSVVVTAAGRHSFLLRIKKALRHVDMNSSMSITSSLSNGDGDGCWRATAMARRRFAHECKRRFPAFPVHPCSGVRLAWDGLCMIVCLYDLVLLPMAAFEAEDSLEMHDTVHLSVAIFWTLDMCMSFNTAYFDGFTIQRSFIRIALTYMRSWFWLDFSIVVNDWFIVLATTGSFGALRYAKLIKTFIRLVRLGRLFKVTSHYQMAMQTTNSEVSLTTIRIGTQAFCVTIICHYVACVWYFLHSLSVSEQTWVREFMPPDATTAYRYCTSLHWALTQLLPASISVQPVNITERVYNIIVILVSMVLFSSFISSITVSMNHLRACRAASIERDGQLRKFLQHYEINHEISHNIWSFLKKSARSSCYTIKPGDVLALKTLPEQILEGLYKDAFEKELRTHPLFFFYSMVEPTCVAKLCRTGIEQHVILSFELLWHDLMVDRMIFVRRGTLIYEKAIGTDLRTVVEAGGWCCEEAIWAVKPRIEMPFSAGVSGCEVLMVNPEIFHTIAKQFPQNSNSLVLLARYGEEFTRRFNQACSNERLTQELKRSQQTQNILFNDAGTIVDILDDIVHHYNQQDFCSLDSDACS